MDIITKCPTCANHEVDIIDETGNKNRITDFTWKCKKCNGFGWVVGVKKSNVTNN